MPSEDAKPVKKEVVVKKGEEEEKSLNAILQARKKNPTNAGTLTTKSGSKATKVKKEEPRDDDFVEPVKEEGKGKGSSGSGSKPVAKVKKEEANGDDDHKPILKKTSASKTDKELNKKKVKKEEVIKKTKGSVTAAQIVKKREKKVYEFPGQKRDPPDERDPLRIFYETLYEQVPESEMAQFWLMESGLLPLGVAKKVNEMKQKRNKFASPVKAISVTKKTQSATVKKKTPPSAVSSTQPKTTVSKVASKQPKKRKAEDESSEDDSDEDFLINRKIAKKQKTS